MDKSERRPDEELQGYDALLEIMERQLALFDQKPNLNSFEAFGQLNEAWNQQVRQMETHQAKDSDQDKLEKLKRMTELSERIEAVIRKAGRDLTLQISSVKQQQKILRSYGGVAASDSVPIYFDEKN